MYAYHVNHLLKRIASGLTISRLLAELWRACAMRLPFARGQPQRFIAKVSDGPGPLTISRLVSQNWERSPGIRQPKFSAYEFALSHGRASQR